MRVNNYKCDFCDKEIPLGYEYKVTTLFPMDEEMAEKYSERLAKKQRCRRTIELCEECFKERLT